VILHLTHKEAVIWDVYSCLLLYFYSLKNTFWILPFSHSIRPIYTFNFGTVGTHIITIIIIIVVVMSQKHNAEQKVCSSETHWQRYAAESSWRRSKANKRTVGFLKSRLFLGFYSAVAYQNNYRKLLGFIPCKGSLSNMHSTKPVLRSSGCNRYRPLDPNVNTQIFSQARWIYAFVFLASRNTIWTIQFETIEIMKLSAGSYTIHDSYGVRTRPFHGLMTHYSFTVPSLTSSLKILSNLIAVKTSHFVQCII
jgi:hypothetical protein